MAEKVAIKVPPEWKEDLIALRDTLPEAVGTSLIAALASRTQEELEALVTMLAQPGGLPPAPVTPAAGTALPPAPAGATTRTSSSAPLPIRRSMEEKPVEEGKIAIIVRNGNLLADTINGKRYPTDSRIQVSPDELQSIEAELSQRRKHYGLSHTRIERLEPA
jgi:hypothetical protein